MKTIHTYYIKDPSSADRNSLGVILLSYRGRTIFYCPELMVFWDDFDKVGGFDDGKPNLEFTENAIEILHQCIGVDESTYLSIEFNGAGGNYTLKF